MSSISEQSALKLGECCVAVIRRPHVYSTLVSVGLCVLLLVVYVAYACLLVCSCGCMSVYNFRCVCVSQQESITSVLQALAGPFDIWVSLNRH